MWLLSVDTHAADLDFRSEDAGLIVIRSHELHRFSDGRHRQGLCGDRCVSPLLASPGFAAEELLPFLLEHSVTMSIIDARILVRSSSRICSSSSVLTGDQLQLTLRRLRRTLAQGGPPFLLTGPIVYRNRTAKWGPGLAA